MCYTCVLSRDRMALSRNFSELNQGVVLCAASCVPFLLLLVRGELVND